jgi:ferrous iron transport protein B
VPDVRITYDREVEEAIVALTASVTPHAQAGAVNPRWLAIRMLEKDRVAERYVPDVPGMVQSYVHHIERHTGEEIDMVIADGRYGFIHGLTRDVVRRADLERVSLTTLIDNIVLNRVLGIPIFFLVMYLIFMLTINVGTPFIEFFDRLCGAVFVDGLGQVLEALGTPAFLRALVADGMGGGVQTVSTFIPPIFFIFLCLAVLEDSGYMARAAFVMDRVLRAIGLPGKAFLPMLVGFGCNVPAILATRTLENPKDRVMTAVMNPFVSCGARLPVYTVFAVAFFPRHGGTLVFALYVTGILLGVLTGLLLRHTLLRGEASTFVMELPPYHMPTVPGILHHTWNNLRGFISRAGKVILAVVVVLSLLNLPLPGTDDDDGPQDSPLSVVGRLITPVFRPMGIRDANWPATVGLFTGLFAKEAVVGTLDSLYAQLEGRAEPGRPAVEPVYLPEAIRHAFAAIPEGFGWTTPETEPGTPDRTRVSSAATPALHKYFETRAAAVAYILFILLYAPCMATLAAIYRETGLRWMAFSLCHMTGLAWLVSTCVYQVTRLTEAPAQAVGWLGFCALALLAAMAFYQHLGRRFAGGRTP